VQCAIAEQIRHGDERIAQLATTLNHAPTMDAVRAERSFLAALEGGCQGPIGALAVGGMLHGFIADVQGQRVVRGEHAIQGDAELTGIRLANELRGQGASEILEGLRRASHLPSPQPE
jgi:hydroxymethylbilane synthase